MDIIENKIKELENVLVLKDSIEKDLETIIKYLEQLTLLNKKIETKDLKIILEKNEYDTNIDKLFNDVNNLIEYFVLLSNEEVILPNIYSQGLNEIKENLLSIKNKLENNLNNIKGKEKDIENLKEFIKILNNESNKQVSEEMLKSLYESIIKDGNKEEVIMMLLELFNVLNQLNKNKKTTYLNEEAIQEEKHITTLDDILDLFKNKDKYEKIRKYIEDRKDEILKDINLDEAKSILNFFNEKNIKMNEIALAIVACYGTLENIKDVYSSIELVKVNTNNVITNNDFTSINCVAMWLNKRSEQVNSNRGKNVEIDVRMPSDLKNKFANIGNLVKNVELIKMNSDIFATTNYKDLYNCNVLRDTPTYIVRKNINLARYFKLSKLNVGFVKNDMENKINLAIELGLMKTPKMVMSLGSSFLQNREVNKEQFEGLYYFENNPSKLLTISENEFAFLNIIMSKAEKLGDFYNKFFNSSHSINDHALDRNYDISKNYYEEDCVTEKELMKNGLIEGYSVFSRLINSYNNNAFSYYAGYFDKEILKDPQIIEFERLFGIKDTAFINNTDDVKDIDEYTYKIENKFVSRYRFLRNASILKSKYGELTKEMLLASVVKDSIITNSDFNLIMENDYFKSLKHN